MVSARFIIFTAGGDIAKRGQIRSVCWLNGLLFPEPSFHLNQDEMTAKSSCSPKRKNYLTQLSASIISDAVILT